MKRPIITILCILIFETILINQSFAASTSSFKIAPSTSGNGQKSLPKRIIDELTLGTTQDLIVVFDDNMIQNEADSLQQTTGLPSHHSRIIEYKAKRFAEHKRDVISTFGSNEAEELKHYSHLPIGFVRINSKAALDKMLAHPGVKGVYENTKEQKFLAQSLPLIGQPQAAVNGYIGSGTAVAVLDTGVDYTLPAFGSCTSPGVPSNCKVVYAQDFAPSDGKLDADGHGTNVAGIVLGVAPGTKIIALDVFGSSGLASASDTINAINWVIANKSNYNTVAINLSLGSSKYTSQTTQSPYFAAFSNARAAGILPIVAAGNDGFSDGLASPAAVIGAISVGAVYDSAMGTENWGAPSRCSDSSTAADKVTCFSNSASFLTLLAPGSVITAAGIEMSGTSQAAPHVAGAAAVLRAAFPNDTLDQTVARLTNGVMVTDSRNDITKPRFNLQMALGSTATCTYSISSTNASIVSTISNNSVTVTTGTGCSWTAGSNNNWISITSGISGSGIGTVSYSVSANTNAASRTGTITVAGQTYTVTQMGSSSEAVNIILNPGFENGPVSWSEATANGLPIITAYLNPTTNNNWYAWLCGYDYCTDTLYQDVTIPANAQAAYIQFNYWITTKETTTANPYDTMTVRVYSPPTATTYKYWSFSNLDATTGWVQSPIYDVSAYKGQTIRLQFSAATDSSFSTDFYLDDVTLMVSGATPDTQSPSVPTGLAATPISTSTINLSWTASSDNVGVSSYKIYRNGALLTMLGNVTSYSNTGLSPSTSYSYTVSACDAAGNCSTQSNSVTVVTPGSFSDTQSPSVPTGLAATPISTSTINLSWTASSDNVGVSSYKIYRNGALLTMLGNVTSYSNTSLSPSTSYSYTVSACDAAGNCSAQSTAVIATTYSPSPLLSSVVFSGPSSYQVNGNTVNIKIDKITNNSWGGHSGSLKIELWALTAPYFGGSVTGYVTASIRTSQISGGSDYLAANNYFSNISLNLPYTRPPASNSSYSLFLLEYDSINCTTSDHFCIIDYMNYLEAQPPSIPTSLTSTAISSSQVNLSWNAATDNIGVATYKIYRNGVLVALLGNVTTYTDGGLSASTPYSYTVSACDAAGNCSAQSASASATTPAAPDIQAPTVPTGLTATAISSTQINLVWNASSDNVGVTAYKIYSMGNLVTTLGKVTSTSRTVAPLTTYSYTVSACDAAENCSAQSTSASATTPAAPDIQAPTVPTGLTATAISSTQINLSWNVSVDNVGVTAYKIYSMGNLIATLGNITSYNHTGLKTLTLYSYTVAACDAMGNCSAQSASASATTSGLLINGACGSSDKQTLTAIPTANLCSSGTLSSVTGSGPWSWTCTGTNGGSTASCSANIQTYTITASVTGGNGTVNCTSPVNYGATSTCTITPATGYQLATFTDNSTDKKTSVTNNSYSITNVTASHVLSATFTVATPINGTCGSSNNTSATTAPTTNLCTTGTASTVTGTGPWSWNCTGNNGGTTASCSATLKTTPVTSAKVFLSPTTAEAFTVATSGTTLYGGTGKEVITINSSASNVTLDQNVDRVKLPGTASSYTFRQTGNQLKVYDATGTTLILTIPVQGDSDGTQINFSNGTYDARLTSGQMTIGGAIVSSSSTAAIIPLTQTTTTEPVLSTTSTAGIYLVSSSFTVADSGATVHGGSGTEALTISSGTVNITFDQNIEQVQLTNPASSYTFKQTGNIINVYDATGTTIIAKGPVQPSPGTTMTFSNGTGYAVMTSGGAMQLGGATISTTTPAPITSSLFPDTTTVTISGSGSDNAATGNKTYNITVPAADGSYLYTISNFATGDKLVNQTGKTAILDNISYTDLYVDLVYSISGTKTLRVRLTGLTQAQEYTIGSVSDLNSTSIFGPGTYQ